MKVTVKSYIYGPDKVMCLEDALRPTPMYCGESVGQFESVVNQAEMNACAIGRLLAWNVETGAMTLEQARYIAQVHEEIEPYTEPANESKSNDLASIDPKWGRPAPKA